jgi:AAA domain-containing protein/bifunctional DNA primase/polymerase-like protein/primase-like protein
MGKISGLFLLDFDFTKHPESKAWYDANKSRLPRTWSERTKSGGMHLYFRWTPALEVKQTNSTSVIAVGVDTKGHGGYSKMTPSEGYTWINPPHLTPLAVPPEWLIALLSPKGNFAIKKSLTSTVKSTSWLTDALAGLKDGNRNETFTRVAGSLRGRGYDSRDIMELLLPKAREVGFLDTELQIICDSVGRYAPNTEHDSGSAASNVESFLENIEIVSWIVPSLIARKSIGFVAGLPETGKTWMLIDLAIEAARGGGKWMGRFDVKPAKVLFIDQERFKGETQRRFRAVLTAKDLSGKDLKGNLFIRCGTTTRINLDTSYQAFRKELEDIRPDLVLIDSFVSFHTVEENNRGEIQTVLEQIKKLRNDFGCTFIFVDHENKGAFHAKDENEQPSAFRMAGSIAKPAAAEFVLTVRRHDPDTSMVYHTKSTLASTVAPFMVKVRDVGDKNKIMVEAF